MIGVRRDGGRRVAGYAVAVLLLAAAAATRFLPNGGLAGAERALHVLPALGPGGAAALVAVQLLVCASGVLPASLVGVLAGAAYGPALGFALAAAGTMAGALLAFALSRSLLRPTIVRLLERRGRLNRFDAALARDGWRFVCLLRLSPLMPFAVTSYALGFSSIRLRDYTLGTLAALPALFGYVFIGSLTTAGLHAAERGAGPLHVALIAIGIVVTVAITWRVGTLARSVSRPADASA